MIINNIPKFTIQSKNLSRNKIQYNSYLNNDIFVKNCSFSGKSESKDEKSFAELKKWAEKTSFIDKVEDIVYRTGRILGSGFEGKTYSIPGTNNWVLKKYNRGDIIAKKNDRRSLIQIRDFSPRLNVGQTIARVEVPAGGDYSYVYYVLKYQTGNSIGVPLSIADTISDGNIKRHIESLRILASSPQKTFDKCIKDIDYVTKQGYEFDCCNPYNFMYDKETQEIHFVDINDIKKNDYTQFGEVLYALLDGEFAINYSNSDCDVSTKNEANKLSNEIIRKFFAAMIQSNSKFSLGTYFNNLLESSLLDETLGCTDKEDKINKLRLMNLI